MNNLQERLAEKLNNVSWHGEYFKACCPFPHDGSPEKTPSMLVNDTTYHCLACGAIGSLHRLEKILGAAHKSFARPQAIVNVKPRWRQWTSKYGNLEEIATVAHKSVLKSKEHRAFFEYRKIDQFIEIGKFGWMDGWNLFPVFDQNHAVVDIIARSWHGKGDAKYIISPMAEKSVMPLYVPDWDKVLKSNVVFIVYGIVDSWALHSVGLPVVTGITGKSLNKESLQSILDNIQKMYIIPDKYEEFAGIDLAMDIGWRAKTLIMDWPENCKDCDDIRRNYGEKELRKFTYLMDIGAVVHEQNLAGIVTN